MPFDGDARDDSVDVRGAIMTEVLRHRPPPLGAITSTMYDSSVLNKLHQMCIFTSKYELFNLDL